ncbi:MAG TPA: NAD(P)-dependent oxidoreductase [Azospirillaceae bacterium]|nr:NAD(P)-dependent oxidoreductase [Azospirillaceae bacterium]
MTDDVVWVTGATGFLAGGVLGELVRRGQRVVAFSRTPPPCTDGPVAWIVSDFTLEVLLEASAAHGRPAHCFHGIGSGSVGLAAANPSADLARTVGTLSILLDALRHLGGSTRLVYPSSAAVYGDLGQDLAREERTLAPVSHYGLHKQLAETVLAHAWNLDGIASRALRLFSIYGEGQRKLLLWDIGLRILRGESPLSMDGTGNETRDYLHVADVARLVCDLMEAPWSGHDLLNAGSGEATTVRSVAEGLADALGYDVEVLFNGRTRPGNPQRLQADTGRLAATGFAPIIPFEEGLARYAAWLHWEHRNGVPNGMDHWAPRQAEPLVDIISGQVEPDPFTRERT